VLEAFDSVPRVIGFDADDLDLWFPFAQIAAGSHDRAAGAEAGDEVRHRPGGIVPDLRAGALVMRLRIDRVEVLVRLEIAIRGCRDDLATHADGAIGSLQRIAENHLGTIGANDLLAFFTDVGGHHELDWVAEDSAGHGQGDARVPRRRVDDRLPG